MTVLAYPWEIADRLPMDAGDWQVEYSDSKTQMESFEPLRSVILRIDPIESDGLQRKIAIEVFYLAMQVQVRLWVL